MNNKQNELRLSGMLWAFARMRNEVRERNYFDSQAELYVRTTEKEQLTTKQMRALLPELTPDQFSILYYY